MNLTKLIDDQEIRVISIKHSDLTKGIKREMGKWLGSGLGRPDRNRGIWWTTEDDTHLHFYFRHEEAFVEFWMKYS